MGPGVGRNALPCSLLAPQRVGARGGSALLGWRGKSPTQHQSSGWQGRWR